MLSIISSELVVPSEATPKKPLWLSNLDLAGRMAHVAMVYFYRPIDSARHDFFSVESLKSSLAKALVPFYPFAGRLGVDQEGRTEIKCTGEGVLFIVARSDTMLDDFDSFAPSSEVRNLYVPPGGQPDLASIPLMVQVTFFKCGGVALGTASHHQVVDGRSAFHFTETWSRIACGEDSFIVPPFFDHTLLAARPEKKIMFDHLEYKSNPKSISPCGISTLYASTVLEISDKHIDALKLHCSDTAGTHVVSPFRAITALLWRCFCGAKKLDLKSETRLYTMIDIRNRMCPPLPPTYFGNAVIRVSVSTVVSDVISSPISHVEKMVHGATKHGDDYARSLIDYLETAGMDNLPRSGVPTSELRVISLLGMPTDNADFGWGKPIFCAPCYYRGYIYLMDSPGKEEGVSAVVSLEPENMSAFKKLFLEELAALDVSDFISN